MHRTFPNQPLKWNAQEVEAIKLEVFNILTNLEKTHSPKQKMAFILNEVNILENETSVEGVIRRFVFVMNALAYHEKHMLLNHREVKKLVDIGYAILFVAGVKPSKSKLSKLYGEIHLFDRSKRR